MSRIASPTILAALACLVALAGCTMRVTVAPPTFGPPGETQQKPQDRVQPAAWWETYGEEPRGP